MDALRNNLRRKVQRQLLCSPTGSGKTEISMYIVNEARRKGSHIYFVCDRQTLVDQTSERFYGAGISHGVLMGQQSRDTWNPILIVSAQTLERRGFNWKTNNILFGSGDSFQHPDLVILDECHEIRKSIIEFVTEHHIPTIGLTATPFTKGLAKHYDAVVNVTSTSELIEQQFLSPLRVIASEREVNVDGLIYNKSTGEWNREDLGKRVMEITGDVVAEWEKHTLALFGGPVPTIVFTPSVADSLEMGRLFNEAGHSFQVVHYKQTPEEKSEILKAYARGDIMGVISCQMLARGYDAPFTRCLVIAYPLNKSLTMHIQMLGRVMRIADGKEFGLVIDHTNNYLGFYDQTHKFFDEGCQTLDQTRPSVAKRLDKKQTAHLKCACGFVLPPKIEFCPACGAARRKPPTHLVARYGELGEVDRVEGQQRGIAAFQGDLWREVCALACSLYKEDSDKARRVAFAKYKSWMGKVPGRDFQWVGRPPHPEIIEFDRRKYRQWKAIQHKQQQQKRKRDQLGRDDGKLL